MKPVSVVVLCVFCTTVFGSWIDDFAGNGLDLTSGIGFHVDEIQSNNLSLLERHSLHMDIAGIRISVSKIPGENKIEFDVYYDNGEEGRGKKMGEMVVPIFIGFKVIAVGILMVVAVGSLVLQSLATAKLSLLLSAILGISKLFGTPSRGKHSHQQPHVRYQELPPLQMVYDLPSHQVADIPTFNALTGIGFDGFANYPSSAHNIAISRTQSAILDAPEVNDSKQQVITVNQQPAGLHKREYKKRTFNGIPTKSRGSKKYA